MVRAIDADIFSEFITTSPVSRVVFIPETDFGRSFAFSAEEHLVTLLLPRQATSALLSMVILLVADLKVPSAEV